MWDISWNSHKNPGIFSDIFQNPKNVLHKFMLHKKQNNLHKIKIFFYVLTIQFTGTYVTIVSQIFNRQLKQ